MNRVFTATNTQKILDFLCRHPGEQFVAVEIQKATKISKGGVSISLRELLGQNLVARAVKGNSYLYSVQHGQSVIRQFKIFRNVAALDPLINRLKRLAIRIILFGSCARGEDSYQSDVDLCLVTNSPKEAEREISKTKFDRKLQTIIRSPVQFAAMEQTDPVFWAQISKGIVLWEAKS